MWNFLVFAAVLVMLYGLATIIKPFWLVRRRIVGAVLALGGFIAMFVGIAGSAVTQPEVPMPERPSHITEEAWTERTELCRQARFSVARCVGDDAEVERARARIAEMEANARRQAEQDQADQEQRAARDLEMREAVWIERTKDAVRESMRNPRSAEFRNVAIYRPFPGRDTPVVCGEVNGENAFGGMTGFQGFIGSGNTVGPFLEEQMGPGEFARSRAQMCVNAGG